jgi:hypothetical protein
VGKNKNVSGDGAAAGAGIAALALLNRLIETLVVNKALSTEELREVLDDALFSLEAGQGDSPVPEASSCARQCLEQLLVRPDSPKPTPIDSEQST